ESLPTDTQNAAPPRSPRFTAQARHSVEQPSFALTSNKVERTLFVVCCSAAKSYAREHYQGATVLESLPSEIATALVAARERVAPLAHLDETFRLPRWRRYSGAFYQAAAPALENAVVRRAHVVILSGGYGVVQADEPIGCYDRAYRPGDWSGQIVQRAL